MGMPSGGPLGGLANWFPNTLDSILHPTQRASVAQPQQTPIDPNGGVNSWLDFSHLGDSMGATPAVAAPNPVAGTTSEIEALLKQMGNGGTGYAGVPFDSKINELKRQLAMAQGLNSQGKSDVNAGYDNLVHMWNNDVPKAFASINKNAQASTTSAAAKLKAALANNYNKATAGSAEQMKKFGIDTGPLGQAAGGTIAAKNASDLGNLQGLQDSRTGANNDFFTKMNAAAGTFAHQAGGLTADEKQRALGELRQQLYNTTMDTQGKIGDLAKERGAAVAQAAQANLGTKLNALMQLRQLQMGPSQLDLNKAAQAKIKTETQMAGQGGGSALDFLRNAAGGDNQKYQDLLNEFTFLTGDFNSHNEFNLGKDKYGKAIAPNSGQLLQHLQGAAQRRGAGQDYISAILKALDVSKGNYGASDYGMGY